MLNEDVEQDDDSKKSHPAQGSRLKANLHDHFYILCAAAGMRSRPAGRKSCRRAGDCAT
jgi:hypothetical protein